MRTAWLRGRGLPAAAGAALLAGIGIGEAIFGLTVVNETTEPTYWLVIGVIGLALLLVMLIRRLRGAGPVILAITGTAAIAAAFVPIYTFVGERGLG